MRIVPSLFCAATLVFAPLVQSAAPVIIESDVCVYAATPSGILAAIAVKREGKSVVIVEPSRWVGGMLGAGLKPMQDCPNYEATGGLTRKLLHSLGNPNWGDDGVMNRKALSTVSPKSVREDFQKLLDEHGIRVIREHRIASCEKRGAAIQSATFDLAPFDELGCPPAEPKERNALRVIAKVFIDASYEGNLMAKAGVSYRVGREAASEFGEEHAGVQPPMELAPIDPFAKPGDPNSGLLAWVENDHGKAVGAADGYTQAYNYRYYTTSDPAFREPITAPPNYDPKEFELVGRYVAYLTKALTDSDELHAKLAGIFPGWMNSAEWNYQRSSLFSMAPVGISQVYASGDDAAQARVWKAHQDYLRGLHEFMSTDPRVPESYRKEMAALGLDKRPHPETHGWPHQLYVRVARRMDGRYRITAQDVYNKTRIEDPVGLAQYGIDTYPSRRIWFARDGQYWVGLEGKMFIGGSKGPTNVPYPIPYRAITPKTEECSNLLVTVCFSASHLGYASARMEPVFMICGESAGIAACRALEENVSVQQINLMSYRKALDAAGQKLTWNPERDKPGEPTRSSNESLTFAKLLKECDTDGDKLVSKPEWNSGKQGWEWLFAVIDSGKDGQIDAKEYAAFQEYKIAHPDWQKLRPGVR